MDALLARSDAAVTRTRRLGTDTSSDHVRRGGCDAAPARQGARRAPAASGQHSLSPPHARRRRPPLTCRGPGGGGPATAKPRERAERLSGRVIGAPWRSRELAATATGAATALRRATQVTARSSRAGVAGVGGGAVAGASDPRSPRYRRPAERPRGHNRWKQAWARGRGVQRGYACPKQKLVFSRTLAEV